MSPISPILMPTTNPKTMGTHPFTATQHITAVITAGTANSSTVDMTQPDVYGYTPVLIAIPSTWTAAKVSFQVSLDNVNWGNLHNLSHGAYETQNNAIAGDVLILDGYPLRGVPYFRVRSGTVSVASNQTNTCDITIVLATF